MRYACSDLGRRRQGCTAVVRWDGSPATVMLLDPVNFAKYLRRMPCFCDSGARYRRSPAKLSIPEDGRWYAVVDLGGNSSGRPPTVEVLDPDDAAPSPGRSQPEKMQTGGRAKRNR